MVEAATMTPDEVIEWLEGEADLEAHDADKAEVFFGGDPGSASYARKQAEKLSAMAQTVRAMRDAAKEAQGVLADLTGANPGRSVLHLWARAVESELALRSSLSPKEGKT